MAHFAKVLDGKVTQVIVAEPEFFDTFVDNTPGTWIQTSYNTRGGIHYDPVTGEPSEDQSKALRKNFASPGFIYSQQLDAFIPPKPFDSWVLNQETYTWDPPVAKPAYNELDVYSWDEKNTQWVKENIEIPPADY